MVVRHTDRKPTISVRAWFFLTLPIFEAHHTYLSSLVLVLSRRATLAYPAPRTWWYRRGVSPTSREPRPDPDRAQLSTPRPVFCTQRSVKGGGRGWKFVSVSSPDTRTRHQTHNSINRLTKLDEDDVRDSDMEEYVGVRGAATENPPHVTKAGTVVDQWETW